MKISVKKVRVYGDNSIERFESFRFAQLQKKYGLPSYKVVSDIGNTDKLWIQSHNIKVDVDAVVNGKHMSFIYFIDKGFVWDKASVPLGKDNILESHIAAKLHDIGCSTHCLRALSENSDGGFRANNKLFKAMLYYYIERDAYARRLQGESRFSLWWDTQRKRRRARLWYTAVNSIVGRGFYETNVREWHKITTRVELVTR